MYLCVHRYTHMYIGRIEVNTGVSLHHSPPCLLRKGLFLNLKLANFARLPGYQVPEMNQSIPPQCWDYR